MRKFAFIAAAAAVAIAAPAQANESRAEVRAGVAWAGDNSEAVLGIAGGHDFDLNSSTFIGFEGSADKILVEGSDVVLGLTGRLGTEVSANGKLYGTLGYSFNEGDALHIGAGYQHQLGGNYYGKIEYRRFLNDGTDVNTLGLGLGITF